MEKCFIKTVRDIKIILLSPIFLVIIGYLTIGYYCWSCKGSWSCDFGHILTLFSIGMGLFYWIKNRKEEFKSIQRNKQLEFLEDSYKKIAMGANRSLDNKKFQEALEEAVAVIQLYGEKELIHSLINNFPNLDPVLNGLRNSLRKELRLEKVEGSVINARNNDETKELQEYQDKKNKPNLDS